MLARAHSMEVLFVLDGLVFLMFVNVKDLMRCCSFAQYLVHQIQLTKELACPGIQS